MKTKAFLFLQLATLFIALIVNSISVSAQDSKGSLDLRDPLGYSWYYDYPSERGNEFKAFLTYSPSVNRSSEEKGVVELDSVYVYFKNNSFDYSSPLGENVISKIYFCSNGNELFLYSKVEKRRNKENWPQIDEVTYKIYGKKVGNTIYIREEKESVFLKKGLVGLIANLCIMLFLSLMWFVQKNRDIKRRAPLDGGYPAGIGLIGFSFVSVIIALAWGNPKWSSICLLIFFLVLVANLIINMVYNPIQKKYAHNRISLI
jgi:hypothetical protein